MSARDPVRIARRFLRSIRIDTDLGDPSALEGFVCPHSSAEILATMASHVEANRHGAFTWTGPYGSGKSSLAVALSALLSGDAQLQKQATRVFGRSLAATVWKALPPGSRGWRVLPVVGRRTDPVQALGESFVVGGIVSRPPRGGWTETNLVATALEAAAASPGSRGGILILIDEMGKFLECAAQDGRDIYVFQQLAEAAARSGGRLLIVGILHQAFEEYARRLSREVRDEWSKIQGRWVDLVVNAAGEEQIDLIARAIESNHHPKAAGPLSRSVAELVHPGRPAESARLALLLENCWPLHPVVASLLGPISRRRFGQNQRSIFGFLNSAEPHGFQAFLRTTSDDRLYGPDQLWDYLRANLEPSILASPDGHRWALAAEALERCEAIGGDALHVRLLKIIAVIDLFKERSGLRPGIGLLRLSLPHATETSLKKALSQLDAWSFTLFKKFQDAYVIFAGSDFDIDEAARIARPRADELDLAALKMLGGLQPILAKRHYHETGALRWFDVDVTALKDVVSIADTYSANSGTVGQFLLALPTEGESEDDAVRLCREAARHSDQRDVVVGLSARSQAVLALTRELVALENVRNTRPELAGDAVARKELAARIAAIQGQLETELRKAFDGAQWFRKHQPPKTLRESDLNSLASQLADGRFNECPKLHNELLNRHRPSSNAIAAQNTLLRRMLLNEGAERLGIDGFPAEGGLFASLLEATGLYVETAAGWRFVTPRDGDSNRLAPAWAAAAAYVQRYADRTVAVSEIYDLWRAQPFGVKDGLMPVLAVAFILTMRDNLAAYREGIFRAHFDDVDVDYLAKDASTIQLRWMDLTDLSRQLLSGLAEVVRRLDPQNALTHLKPIDVARGLVSIFEQLPLWSRRTLRLSANAIRVRDLFKRARDPNQLLFNDIPSVIDPSEARARDEIPRIISGVREGLEELVFAYPSMLRRLRDTMLAELQVPNLSPQSLAELRGRAANVRQLAGDFRVEAFVGRVAHLDSTDASFEGIASLAADKPPRDWVDPDLDRALVDIADMSQRFLRAETFTRVQGRPEKRHAMAVVLGVNGRPAPMMEEFAIADTDRGEVDALIARLEHALEAQTAGRRSIVLAALAQLSVRYMRTSEQIEGPEVRTK